MPSPPAEQRLQAAGFCRLEEAERWLLAAPAGAITSCAAVPRSSPSSSAARRLAEAGFRLIGAHTDSPGLRLKPKPAEDGAGLVRLGVEVYGGPILATFADRDLSLAGRVNAAHRRDRDRGWCASSDPLLRLPNLAIHMNREVNESGLKFNKQTELPLLLGQLRRRHQGRGAFAQPAGRTPRGVDRPPC
jgi:aspartyl aminopeptidase